MSDALDDWAAAWSSHDIERVLALFTDDGVYEDVPFGVAVQGRDQRRALANLAFTGIPDFEVEVTTRFVAGPWGLLEWVFSGTHAGDFPGLPATGRRFSRIRGASVIELDAGRIRRESDYWNVATFTFGTCH